MTTSHVVRVATWNILSGRRPDFSGVDLDGVADGVMALNADIVALQEVDRALPRTDLIAQLDTIARLAGYQAVFVPALAGSPGKRWRHTPDDDGVGRAYGIGLLTRIPMLR